MLTRRQTTEITPGLLPWREEIKRAIRDPRELCQLLELPAGLGEAARRVSRDFPLFVPRPLLTRIKPADPDDPLLRQIFPLDAEQLPAVGFTSDPVHDRDALWQPGVIRKYHGRALLITTGACAVHCRYCFRRFFPYAEGPKSPDTWRPAIEQLATDQELEEVILSGGDPLTLSDDHLQQLVGQLERITQLRRLRVHTRLPILIPQRVTEDLLRCLTQTRLCCIVVVHVNHPCEIDTAVANSLRRLVDRGLMVLNQSVLLRGVNDQVEVSAELSRRLIALRVMPYYLHQLDRVAGAAHFEVPAETGVRLMQQLRQLLPGYAIPRYVRDDPDRPSKTILA